MSDGRDRLWGFDGLRAIAALSIVGLHAASATGATGATSLGRYFARLDIGVAVFFVISAFLLYRPFVAAHLGLRGPVSWRAFWWRRALRIYPAYWVALTSVWLAFGHTHLHGFTDYARHYLLVQIYQPKYGLAGVVPAWTLAVEVSFYAALPLYAGLVDVCTRRLAASRRVRAELVGVAAVYVLGIAVRLAITHARGTDAVSARWLPAMADWFALGLLLAVLRTTSERARRVADRSGDLFVAGGVVAFLAVCNIGLPTGFSSGTVAQDLGREILFGLASALLVAPCALGSTDARSLWRRVLDSRAAVLVGTVSYGVFLWHYDWIVQLREWGAFDWLPPVRLVSVLLIALALATAAAAASWVLVERPILARKERVGGAAATAVPAASSLAR